MFLKLYSPDFGHIAIALDSIGNICVPADGVGTQIELKDGKQFEFVDHIDTVFDAMTKAKVLVIPGGKPKKIKAEKTQQLNEGSI